MDKALQKPPPVIRQLRSGQYAVFNMEGTPLWEKTFSGERARYDAFFALVHHYERLKGMTRWLAYCEAEKAMPPREDLL